MEIFYNVVLFLIGVGLGSAGNALIDRLPRKESWVKGRSHCDKCKHVLNINDLIPVFSFLWLGGRCRYCRAKIPIRNLILELIMGIFAVISYQLSVISLFFIFWVTVVVAVMDMENRLVSEGLILIWAILVISYQLAVISWTGMLLGILIIGGIWALSRGRAMGFGDVEIAAVMGLSLGWQKILVALWIAFVAGALVGLVLITMQKAKAKSAIAFGPFLILGYWIAYFTNYVPW